MFGVRYHSVTHDTPESMIKEIAENGNLDKLVSFIGKQLSPVRSPSPLTPSTNKSQVVSQVSKPPFSKAVKRTHGELPPVQEFK